MHSTRIDRILALIDAVLGDEPVAEGQHQTPPGEVPIQPLPAQ